MGLGPLALAWIGTPEGMTQAEAIGQAKELMRTHGEEWPREWLRRRGLGAWVAAYDGWAAAGEGAAGEARATR